MYADKATETKLVNAIKEAAQRIDYSGTDDPETILADCLMKQGLHDGFAKTAANAINKSYSVYYMSTHDDSDRDADHRLLDGDKVKVKMCKEDIPSCPHTSKPVEEPAIVSVKRVSTIGKAASEHKPEYTPRTFSSDKEYLDWLANGLYKFASAFDQFYADTCGATEKIYVRHKQAREMDMDDYTVQCIMSHNHRDTNELLNTLGHTKRASKIAMFGTGKLQELPRIIPDNRTSATIFSLVRDAGIIKTAHDSVSYMLKEAGELKDRLVDLINEYEYKCLTKSAAKDDDDTNAGDVVGSLVAVPGSVISGLVGGLPGAVSNVVENARMMAQDNKETFDNNRVLDAELLKGDRTLKNLEAWAEVASNKDLARYPLTDLFEVTQKIIKANPQFERPDSVPMLIDTVKQVMSQGGQIGLAMHGATAKTLSDLAKARGSNITGNDIYAIRDAITGEKGTAEYRDISGIFKGLTDAGDKLSETAPGVLGDVSKTLGKVYDAVKYDEKREKEKEKAKLELDKSIAELKEYPEEMARRKKIQEETDKYNEEVRKRNLDQWAREDAARPEKERRDQEAYDWKVQEHNEKEKAKADAAKDKADEEAKAKNIKMRADQIVRDAANDPYLNALVQAVPNVLKHPDLVDRLRANPIDLKFTAGLLNRAVNQAGPQSPNSNNATSLAKAINNLLRSDNPSDEVLRNALINNPNSFIAMHPQLSVSGNNGKGKGKGKGNP